MMTATSQRPDVPLPAGIELAGEFDSDGYRDIFGVDRTIEDHQARVYALGSQNSEGAIVVGLVIVADGESEGFDLNSDQARALASALLAAADEVDGWANR